MNAFVRLIYLAVMVYAWLIVGRALLSWLRLRRGSVLYRIQGVLYDVTEPYLSLFRRVIPVARGGGLGIDLSSLAALLVLFIVLQVLA
ncbi:MAG: YggT family protein [Thermoleophilia bacterium]